jgi:hypothetical protein
LRDVFEDSDQLPEDYFSPAEWQRNYTDWVAETLQQLPQLVGEGLPPTQGTGTVSPTPICPGCGRPFAPLSPHDWQALALANTFPWVCSHCLAVSDESGSLMPIETVQEQERSHYLAIIQTLRTVEIPRTLLARCEAFRAAFAPGSEVRHAWTNVASELLNELWAIMERIGGAVPQRPAVVKSKPRVGEVYCADVLDAIGDVVRWCEGKRETPPADTPPPAATIPAWNRASRTLRLGDQVLYQYSRRAPKQFMLLDAFQAAGWPQQGIDRPPGLSPSQAKDTVEALNEHVQVSRLRFERGMDDRRIRWSLSPV